jgi:transcriptional regulator with XRE-family HTH domain
MKGPASRGRRRTVSPEEAFGIVLQQVRRKRGLSQEQLAFEAGVHRTYISQLERGIKSISLRTLWDLSDALQIGPTGIVRMAERVVRKGEQAGR